MLYLLCSSVNSIITMKNVNRCFLLFVLNMFIEEKRWLVTQWCMSAFACREKSEFALYLRLRLFLSFQEHIQYKKLVRHSDLDFLILPSNLLCLLY